jgi:hypothetical protein
MQAHNRFLKAYLFAEKKVKPDGLTFFVIEFGGWMNKLE